MPAHPPRPEEPAHDVLAAEEFVVPGADPRLHREAAHDVLAAEEFVVPGADPRLHREAAHDVLAAEEFVVPGADPRLHHGPVALPDDPSGIAEPHDVLAAEEFALPAPRDGFSVTGGRGQFGRSASPRGALLALAALAILLLRQKRHR